MNLIELLATGMHHGGDRAALLTGERTVTYQELAWQAGSLALHLPQLGVAPGDRVALLLPTMPEYVVAYFGILGAGAVAVPINPRARGPEIQHVFDDCRISAVIAHADAVPELQKATATSPSRCPLIVVGGPATTEAISLAALIEDAAELDSRVATDDDLAQIVYTSGTTGKPKGVMLSHRSLALNAEASGEHLGLQLTDRMLAIAPLLHILGTSIVMNATLRCGGTMVFSTGVTPGDVVRTIAQQGCTCMIAVPALYSLLLQQASPAQLRSLRTAITGGAPCDVGLLHAVREQLEIPLIEGWGLTEAGGAVTCTLLQGPSKPGSVGIPLSYMQVAVRDDEGHWLEPAERGELCVKGPTIMRGYWAQPEATAQTLQDGWLATGDVGYADEDGHYFIVDRKKDVIITAGFNVYPREVEEVLLQHPAVAEVGVVGVPAPVKGERVRACIVLRAGTEASPAELIGFCKDRLTPYKVPAQIVFVPALPLGPTGKLLRRALRDLGPSDS